MSDESWQIFRKRVAEHVPGVPASATREFDISRHGVLDHFQRVILKSFTLDLNTDLDPRAIEVVRTLGELADLIGESSAAFGEIDSRSKESYQTRRVKLRPIEPEHIRVLYDAATHPMLGYRWKFRGRTPSPEEFQATLFRGVVSQFMALDGDNSPVGLVVAHDEDPAADFCHISFLRCGPEHPGAMAEAMLLFIEYLFVTFPYSRLYAELPEYNLDLISGMPEELVSIEARLNNYFWHDGRRWDKIFIVVQIDAWQRLAANLFP